MPCLLLIIATLLSLCVGCEANPDTLRVQVCGNLQLGSDVDSIRIVVRDEDRTPAYSGLDELDIPAGDAEGCAPLSADLELPPGEGRAWVEVQALRDGLQVAVSEVRAENNSAILALTRVCLGVSCPLGQTCFGGECESLPIGGDISRCGGACAQ